MAQSRSLGLRQRFAGLAMQASVALAVCLPFVLPFDTVRNIDAQGLLIIVVGGFAWGALILKPSFWKRLLPWQWVLVGLYMLAGLVSVVVNPHVGYDLLGAPYIRLGAGGLLACVGFGLLVTDLPRQRLVSYLYMDILLLALVSIPYSLLKFHTLRRFGGVFAQADIMACVLGCGILFGLDVVSRTRQMQRRLLLSAELCLVILLLLTETRAVIVLTIILLLLWAYRQQSVKLFKRYVMIAFVGLLVLGGLHALLPSRLTNIPYASASVSYRLNLQEDAVKSSTHKPLFGYGPGNLADALDCRQITARALQKSCHQGYFFNSSHNIFLDRILAIGWVGGIALIAFALLSILEGLGQPGTQRYYSYCALLICAYYLTNVTNIELELLFWITLFRPYKSHV